MVVGGVDAEPGKNAQILKLRIFYTLPSVVGDGAAAANSTDEFSSDCFIKFQTERGISVGMRVIFLHRFIP